MTDTIRYGEWPSPISAALVAGDAVTVSNVQVDGDVIWWLERRPEEAGRGVLVRCDPDGEPEDVTPDEFDVRTLVHEYGGGDFHVEGGVVWFANFDDQRLYRQRPGTDPEPITPDPAVDHGDRYADPTLTPDGETLYCVRERHHEGGSTDPTNELVMVPAAGGEPTVVASGHDFYSFPRVSPDGEHLAWTTWDHPNMPWDGTQLHVARIDGGYLTDERVVLGGDDESVFQPRWRAAEDGDIGLYAVSDRTGWWNLYRVPFEQIDAPSDPEPLCPIAAEFGVPQWGFDGSTYAFLDDGRIATIVGEGGRQRLHLLDPDGSLDAVDLPYEAFPRPSLRSTGTALAFVAAGPTTPPSVIRWTPGEEPTVIRRSFDVDVPEGYLPQPESIEFPTEGETAHAHYYPPQNPTVAAPDDKRPPLIVKCHGGPTGESLPTLSMGTAFWTSRGFAVVDVNYRGSSGFGRAYRERLYGEWGLVDVVDCVNAARYLGSEGLVDPDRQAIRGGSAGGYVTLCALAFHDAVDAGTSYYGVADLRALAEHTHKFESRYLDQLVGPLPDDADVYRERSPLHHADGIDVPALLLQGTEDAVVPPEQAREMVNALAETGVDHACVEFEDERHGFLRADTRKQALETELVFYGSVFGLDPNDDLDPLTLSANADVTTVTPE